VDKSLWSFFTRRPSSKKISRKQDGEDKSASGPTQKEAPKNGADPVTVNNVLRKKKSEKNTGGKAKVIKATPQKNGVESHQAPKKGKRGVTMDLNMDREKSLKLKTDQAVALWTSAGVDLSQHSADFSDSTASFRLRCKEHSNTLPEINLDLSEEELDELAPRVKESWLRLQAILES
jgi:hypothetical protein